MKTAIHFFATIFTLAFLSSSVLANNYTTFDNCNPTQIRVKSSKKYGGVTGKNFYLFQRGLSKNTEASKIQMIEKISIKHNRRIEQIQVTLSDNSGKKSTKKAGGNGGDWSHIYLQRGEFITDVKGRSGTLIDQITFYTNKGRTFGPYGGNGGNPFTISTPRNSRVVGFSGKYDQAINQFALVYISRTAYPNRVRKSPKRTRRPNNVRLPLNRKVYITSKIGNLNLDVRGGSKKSQVPIWMYKPNTSAAQHWIFENAGSGYYRIKSAVSGLYLEAKRGSKKSGAPIVQAPIKRGNTQLWKAISAGGGYFYLKSKNSNLYLDVQGGRKSSKTPVWQHPLNKTNAQKWKLKSLKRPKKRKGDIEFEDWQYDCG